MCLITYSINNDIDIVALTETWLSNEENNNKHVITECSNHGYTLHHVPRNSGSTGGGVGVLINDRVKLVTRLDTLNTAVSFESMEMIIIIVSISIRLVVIYRMPPSKKFADKISDHMALHVSLACQRPYPERKDVYVRALRRINNDSLEACLNIDIECDDVNVVVAQYDSSLSRLLDKHAPLKKICIC